MRIALPLLFVVVALVGCSTEPEPTTEVFPSVPAHMPPVPFPADNPITREKAELGRHLFFDGRMSRDGKVPCAGCHVPSQAFSDAPNQVSVGFDGLQGQHNSPSIVNAGYRKVMFWDGRAATLEEQAMGAFLNAVEMNADTFQVANLLRSEEYRGRWKSSFGDTTISMKRAMQAIATFERTLVSANSRYDKFLQGDSLALSMQERRGMNLFFSSRTMCSACHGGPDLTDDQFHNVGLFHHYLDRGRNVVTKDPSDEGKFKTPTLRNVALTAPYMATGDSELKLLNTLEDVVDHYNDGGTPFHSKDKRVKKLGLSDTEKAELVSFMKALTDSSVLSNPNFTKP